MDTPENFDRIETAANVTVQLTGEDGTIELPVSSVDRTKEIDIDRVRESGVYPDGYGINGIDVDGSLSFAGSKARSPSGEVSSLDDLLYDSNGVPLPFNIEITHDLEGDSETIEEAIVVSDGYSVNSGETSETSYDFIAQRIS
jgi:hypothetical protein